MKNMKCKPTSSFQAWYCLHWAHALQWPQYQWLIFRFLFSSVSGSMYKGFFEVSDFYFLYLMVKMRNKMLDEWFMCACYLFILSVKYYLAYQGWVTYMYMPEQCHLWFKYWLVACLVPNHYCPASRTTLVATRFRVAVICPIIQMPHCIRVFFYFIWFVFINHIFQFYYELCTYCNILDIYYHKILILSIMFCFIWSYWIIYFLACLEVSWRVVS